MQDFIYNEYFNWLYDLVCKRRGSRQLSYRKLLIRLHDIDFIYSIPNDQNRAEDGVDLRRRFIITHDYEDSYELIMDILDRPCTVLEMMVALAIRCEEWIMDDPTRGDRTSQWFWTMVVNLGLGAMSDSRFDKDLVDEAIYRFLDREYEPNGKGGLFTVKRYRRDMRTVEIWDQLNWYLDSIV